MSHEIKRLAGYCLGFLLFYAPFAFFQKTIFFLVTGRWMDLSIHSLCLRIPIEHILDGRFFRTSPTQLACVMLLILLAIFCGPIFCGKLCPAGAFPEYLSRIVPARFKIEWGKHVDIVPIRYGMMVGFMTIPFFSGILACAYCNYYLFDLFTHYYIFGYSVSLSSSLLLTMVFYVFIFGLFTKGGRGFCNFLCPVGAFFNFCWFLGRFLPYHTDIKIDQAACVKCGQCQRNCPMDAVIKENGVYSINKHNCILCGTCKANCPQKAIEKGWGKHHEA